jgi:O-antigen/teichoic acid export membrane protein
MSGVSIRLLRTASWNLLDQVLSALSNIVLSIVVARSVSAAGFGAFASAFVVFGISIAVTKSIVGQPLQMRFSDATPDQRREANAAALGCALVLGLAAGLLVAVAAFVVSGSVGSALLALAIVLPGLLVQDSCRMAAFARGRPSLAALMDAVWAIVSSGLMRVCTWARDRVRARTRWGGSRAVSAVPRLVASPSPAVACGGWLRRHRDLIRFLLPDLSGLGAMVGILLVGLIASANAVGSLRAAQVLLGPLGVLGGVFQFSVPGSRVGRIDPRARPLALRRRNRRRPRAHHRGLRRLVAVDARGIRDQHCSVTRGQARRPLPWAQRSHPRSPSPAGALRDGPRAWAPSD